MKCAVCGQESYHDKYCSWRCEQQAKGIKTYAAWEGNLSDYLQLGDVVDQEMVDYFVNELPPAYWSDTLVQMGEPYSHVEAGAIYATLHRTQRGWEYAGHCLRGKHENLKGWYETQKELGL